MDRYREALHRLALLDETEEAALAPSMHSALYGHERPTQSVVVLLHGLTSSPRQFVQFAQQLHARGHTVVVPRLPRHGHADRLTPALADLRRDDLITAVSEAIDIAHLVGERVSVLGFSLGGLLAAWIAQFRPDVAHVTCVAPFLGIIGVPYVAQRYLAHATWRLPNRFVWWDPVARERLMPAHGYPRYATHALATCQHLSAEIFDVAEAVAPKVKEIVMFTNARESSVNNRTISRLVAYWRANGGQVDERVLRNLPVSHDIIEPMRRRKLHLRVYPVLLDIYGGVDDEIA